MFGGIYNFSILKDSLSGSLGDISYQKDNLLGAYKHYTDILKNHSGGTLLEADTLYNLGNTLYRLGQWEKDTERIKLWKESVDSYTKSLALRGDTATEENLTFVKEKLQKEGKEQEKKKEEQQKKEQEEKSGSGTNQEQDPSKNNADESGKKEDAKNNEQWKEPESGGKKENNEWSGSEKNKPQSGQNWSNGWSYSPIGWQDKDSVNSQLSDTDRQEVKKYLEALKQFEKQNGKLLNPEKWGGLSDQIRNFFGSDSFFQDVLPTNDGKKDW